MHEWKHLHVHLDMYILVLASMGTCEWKTECVKTVRQQARTRKTNWLKDFISKYHIFLPKDFTLTYIALLFLQHVCINLKDHLTMRARRPKAAGINWKFGLEVKR